MAKKYPGDRLWRKPSNVLPPVVIICSYCGELIKAGKGEWVGKEAYHKVPQKDNKRSCLDKAPTAQRAITPSWGGKERKKLEELRRKYLKKGLKELEKVEEGTTISEVRLLLKAAGVPDSITEELINRSEEE
ncbi:TPA: hypothetical protein H1008_00805 [archaeon]|nr:hypothetical protein [Candidatus Undinarchaeales archaeon SRR5007147.bin71]